MKTASEFFNERLAKTPMAFGQKHLNQKDIEDVMHEYALQVAEAVKTTILNYIEAGADEMDIDKIDLEQFIH